MPASILFTDIDGTIVHYPDAQDAWGQAASPNAGGANGDGGTVGATDGEWVQWVDRVSCSVCFGA
jgi:hypothetical protein